MDSSRVLLRVAYGHALGVMTISRFELFERGRTLHLLAVRGVNLPHMKREVHQTKNDARMRVRMCVSDPSNNNTSAVCFIPQRLRL
jgi:hypothetical protein